jgi:DNA-binding transcriptional regulator YiaG
MTPRQLKIYRRRLGLSQVEFAAQVGVAPNTVARWERGELGMKGTTARLLTLLVQTTKLTSRRKRTRHAEELRKGKTR